MSCTMRHITCLLSLATQELRSRSVLASAPIAAQITKRNSNFTQICPRFAEKCGIISEKFASIFDGFGSISERKAPIFERNAPIFERNAPISERKALISERKAPICKRNASIFGRKAPISERKASISEPICQAAPISGPFPPISRFFAILLRSYRIAGEKIAHGAEAEVDSFASLCYKERSLEMA